MNTFKAGAPVWWLRTRGGGGGSGKKTNEKERIPAFFIRYGKGSKVEIRVDPEHHSAGARDDLIWVIMDNVVPRPEYLRKLRIVARDETERELESLAHLESEVEHRANMDGMEPGAEEQS